MANYFVSTSGNDSASGSESAPWRNVAVGAARLSPGDTLFVRAGTYAERLNNVIPSGTSWSNKIRIANYPGETVWLRPTSGGGHVIDLTGGTPKYIEIDGINADASNVGRPLSIHGLPTSHIRIKNCELIFDGGSQYATVMLEGNDCEFTNVEIHGGGAGGGGLANATYGIYIVGSRNIIDGCDIYDVNTGGIHVYNGSGSPNDNIIRNTRVHNITRSGSNFTFGMLIAGLRNQVYNNLIYDLNLAGAAAGEGAFVVGGDNKIWNNTVAKNTALTYGIKINSGNGINVRNNIIADVSTAFLDNGSGTVFANNIGPSAASGWTNVNPQFQNANARDFRLTDTSPAIDAGATITQVTTDIDGGARPAGAAYDIGAYEFGAFGGSPGSPPDVPSVSPGSPADPVSPVSPGDFPEDEPPSAAPGTLTIVTDFYSDHDMQCPASWYGGFKEGRVIRFGEGERALSNMWTGEWAGATFDLSISDFDRKLRQQLNSATDRYWVEPLTVRMTTRANRAVLGTPYTVFVGPIIDIRPQNPLLLDLTLGDIVSQALITDDQQLPWRIIRDGFINELTEIAESLDLDSPEPIIYGQHRRVPDVDPASPQGFQVTPIYLGIEFPYHVWMVCGHACADLPDVLVWTPDEFGGLGTSVSVLADGDWLIPHTSAAAYEDRTSITFGNLRRYTLIRGLMQILEEGEPTDADLCATGEKTLTCFVDGVEDTGEGTGTVITSRLEQYKHFLINYVVNRGPLSYQSGAYLTNPTWDLFDGAVDIVEESSFDDAAVIAELRMPAASSPPTEAGYIGAAIIGARSSDRASVRTWIQKWNVSCGVQFGITHFGQIRVSMLHPTEAIKAAAPLYTDAYEILETSFGQQVLWQDTVNRVPWRADYEYTSGQWKTSDVAMNDAGVTQYGREILGEIREYPFAPGETAANHLAQMESRIRAHPRRIVELMATVGHDDLGDSLGYRDLGDYIRYKHFDAVSSDKSEIRLAYLLKHQAQAGARKIWVQALDVDDLIGFDDPDGFTELGSPLNETCANAIAIPAGEFVNYTITIDTSAHATDPSVGDLCGSPSDPHNAAWWSYTPTQAQRGHVTTGTSNYDTILAVYSGGCGALTQIECNDNDGVFQTSFIEFTASNFLQAGVTYHFLVVSKGSPGGGQLVFTFFAEPL